MSEPNYDRAGRIILDLVDDWQSSENSEYDTLKIPHGIVRDLQACIRDDDEPRTPCRCSALCDTACKGQCGCMRCHEDYMDFLSGE